MYAYYPHIQLDMTGLSCDKYTCCPDLQRISISTSLVVMLPWQILLMQQPVLFTRVKAGFKLA